jgi:hypothetical protein
MQKLMYVVTAAAMTTPRNDDVQEVMNAVRGGNNSGTPLGCYTCQHQRTYTSDYVKENATVIASWAYDLGSFLTNARSADGGVPEYKVVRDFASDWWKTNSSRFGQLPSMHRSAWVYEAILDGVLLWSRTETLDGRLSADGVIYFDVALQTYQKASPVEIFGAP